MINRQTIRTITGLARGKAPNLTATAALLAVLLLATALPASADTFAAGSYIIPMDTTYQDSGMLKASGLVYNLLAHGVPVRWTITPGKSSQGTDFTASATDLKTSATIINHGYRGGPFVIDSADTSLAFPLIQAWWAAHPSPLVTVHRATAAFTVPVARYLVNAPKLAVHADGNQQIAITYLAAASVPDSQGQAWPTTSPDLLTPAQVAGPTTTNHQDGALFDSQGVPVYNWFASMHWALAAAQASPETIAETGVFLGSPALFFAECQAVVSFENDTHYGGFLSTLGLQATAQPASVDYYNPSLPIAQIDGTFSPVGGNVPALAALAGGVWRPLTSIFLAGHGASPSSQAVAAWGAAFGSQPGRVFYLGGHQFTVNTPMSTNPQSQGVRLFLNSLFATPGTATSDNPGYLTLSGSASSPAVGQNSFSVTIAYQNPGATPAWNPVVTLPLPAGGSFVSAGQGGSYASGQVQWTLPHVGAGTNGQVTCSLTVATNAVYTLNATANYQVGVTPFSASSPSFLLAHSPVLTATPLPPAHLQIGVAGDGGRDYQLLASGDLVHWSPITNATAGGAISVSLVSTQQFFRALAQ